MRSSAASASSTEPSVLARQIAVWPNLIPYHSRSWCLVRRVAKCSCIGEGGKHTVWRSISPLNLLQASLQLEQPPT